ncbi:MULTISPECIES: PAS domain S-box protein [unclassified Cupriavidus]|uniref:PAS domain S-box protein n=1 Tax=unclassified Cupriavidus TaxID=2640874 RepID=UPI001C00099C|nr:MULTISPECIES: PAS domain S-box protein [unclassified Cupriavidus]MCA3189085.1 PAS domain S-box protein [Cupriavidus sp.]MCA3198804.1 PAS domain S-box protein [Cupriavidus sp.]MCA3201550.1 PAS domain S-box protein [Cupriavidus sp.]MCA3207173.1 PAS domain S-box protein [Cupriavidus sp.]MCA3232111.1 PAS domain S-box protein [Cupriavidus sp.]
MDNAHSRTVDALPALVWTAAADGRTEFVNRRWHDYTGLTVSQALGDGWHVAVHPQDLPAWLASWRGAVASGNPVEGEARLRRFDGTYRWFLCRISPVMDASGKVEKWYGVNSDIEDRKQAEAALHVQQERFRAIAEELPGRVRRAEALLAGERRLLGMVCAGQPLPAVLEGLCHLAEEIESDCLCSISLIDAKGKAFEWVGSPSLPDTFMYPVHGGHVGKDVGPCGAAAHSQEQVLVSDIEQESRWPKAWRELSLVHGLRACWSTPIPSRGRLARGVVAIYRASPGNPTPFQLELINQIVRIAGIAIRRSRSDLALKTSEERFRAIVETTPEFVKVIGGDGTLLHVNAVGAEIAGARHPEVLVGTCFYDLVVAEHRDRYVAFNEKICAGNKGNLEFDIVGLDGKRRQLETHAAPMRIRDGAVAQLAVTRDITAQKQANEALRRSAALMAKVEHLTHTGSFCWRPASDEFIWSDQLYRIFDFEPGTLVTMDRMVQRIHPGDHHLLEHTLECVRNGDDLECDHRLILSDGSLRYVSLRAHASRDDQDRLEYIGAIQDVTERRESEEALSALRGELAHVSRVNSLGTLTASIAHEISQPLSGILMNASTGLRMLSVDPPNIPGAMATVQRTLRDGRRASDVVTRLRALFQKKTAETDAVDLAEATREVVELLRTETRKRRIALRLETIDDPLIVPGDRVQLQQVVLNLLLNAIEAMDGLDNRPRRILVRIERDGPACARLAVTDSGIGFSPQDASRLFDAFYTSKGEGMGIGLSVSRRIVESHGGRLWATANHDFGATFSFSVPCRRSESKGENATLFQPALPADAHVSWRPN